MRTRCPRRTTNLLCSIRWRGARVAYAGGLENRPKLESRCLGPGPEGVAQTQIQWLSSQIPFVVKVGPSGQERTPDDGK